MPINTKRWKYVIFSINQAKNRFSSSKMTTSRNKLRYPTKIRTHWLTARIPRKLPSDPGDPGNRLKLARYMCPHVSFPKSKKFYSTRDVGSVERFDKVRNLSDRTRHRARSRDETYTDIRFPPSILWLNEIAKIVGIS